MTHSSRSERSEQEFGPPELSPILISCYGPFAAVVCVLYAYALWANVHDPGRIAVFLKSLRGSARVLAEAQPPAAATAPNRALLPQSGGTLQGKLVVASGGISVAGGLEVANGDLIIARGKTNIASGDFQLRGAQLSSFVVEIVNFDGKLHHATYVSFASFAGSEGRGTFSRIRGASSARRVTPYLGPKVGLEGGGGIDSTALNRFIFDTEPQVAGDTIGMASVVYNDTGVPLTVELGLADTVSGKRHVTRPALYFRNALSAAAFDLNPANIPDSKRVAVRVLGFFR